MKLLINLLLLALAIFLGYVLYNSIREPIAFGDELARRQDAVVNRLRQIRSAQQIYRDVSGGPYAKNFPELINTLKTGNIPVVSVYGDPDDPNFDGVIRYDTILMPAIDSIRSLKINIDSLPFIPFSGGKTFDIKADTATYQQAKVQVVEVGTQYKTFMGPYADPRFTRYRQDYDPEATIKFGNMGQPTLSGNWE